MPYLRLSKLTKEQEDLRDWTYEAKKILEDNGFDCVVTENYVTSPREYPASIDIIGKKP
jgi:hypothetical protein